MALARSIYFKEDSTVQRIEALAEETKLSYSEIIEKVLLAVLPTLERKAPSLRKFQIDVEVSL